MKQRDTYDGSDAPFQGNVVLRLRGIPVNARITNVTATITPIRDKGGSDPFTEIITVANHSGDFGTTEADTVDWVEVDFHTRRTLAAVAGSNLKDATVQVDVGGGVYVDISKTGGFLTPSGPVALQLQSDSEALPALSVAKLKLTNPTKSPTINQVTIRSVPSNLSLRIGDLAPFWTHVGEMPLAETTPDFAALLQNYLVTAKVECGSYIVPFTVHSDTLARLRIDLDIEQVSQTTAIPAGLKEVVQPFDFSSLPQPQADVLQVEVPANARVVSELTSAKVKGGFAPTRVVLGPTGPVSPGGVVEVSPSATLAQPFTIPEPTGVTGIDLLITCTDPSVSLQADIRADLAGKPDNPPLFRGPVDLSLEKKSAGESQSFWASVALPTEFHLDKKTYWLVLQSLNGTATWSVTSPESGSKAVMQRSQDGGFSWRVATPQPQPSGPPSISGPLAAFFRLRRKPDQFQVPIDLLVGSPPNAARIKLDRFAPLGRVDFAPTDEVTSGFTQYFSNVAGNSSHSCPQGEQLANGSFEQWSVVAGGSGTVLPVDLGAVQMDAGVSVAVSPNGELAYVGVSMDGEPQIQVIDVLCDQLATDSELDLQHSGDPLLAVAPNSSRLYAAIGQDGNKIHLVDITRPAPAEIGSSVDTTNFTTGLNPAGIAVSPDSSRLYFVGQNISSPPQPDELLAFSTASLEQAARGVAKLQPPDTLQIKSGEPSGLAISVDGSRLYLAVASVLEKQIWVLDAHAIANGPLQIINVSCQPAAIALTPDGTHAIVVGPGTSSTKSPGALSIVELASQVNADVTLGGVPTSVVVSPDGQRALVGGSVDSSGGLTTEGGVPATGSITIVDLRRGSIVQTIGLDGVPRALAISPQGDRVYVAKDTSKGTPNSTPIDIISLGSRVPAEWTLTAGSVKPFCLSGNIQTVALLGHIPAAAEPAPSANGLSQVVPSAACTYDFGFWGLSDLDGAIGEVLWLDQTGQLLRADQLPIQTWIQPSGASGASTLGPPPPSPTPSPSPSPAPDLDLPFEKALAGAQPPVLHRSRLTAPDGTVQAEVRFTVPEGGLAAVGMASLAGTSAVVTNSDLQILQSGVPAGWSLTPKGAAVSISPVEGGVEIQNGVAATAELVQTSSLQAGQKFTVEITGSSLRQPQAQQNPSIELHWLKDDGNSAGTPTVLEIQPQDFDHLAGVDTVPKDTTRAEVHVVIPSGTSLTISQLSVESLQTTTVPVSFIAQSPGELTISDLRVGYEKTAPRNPSIPSGGLAPATPPNQNPGEPAGDCHCPCCGEDTHLSGTSSVKTQAGKPATVGNCINCGATVVRLGGPLVAGAPHLSLPVVSRILRAGLVSGSRTRGPGPTTPSKMQLPLTAVRGIGPNRAQELNRFGIYSIRELAAARPQVVAKVLTGVSLSNAPHFIDEARKLLEAGAG
jgi:DNA-binding beta-propeller fold protein YncE